MCTAASQFVYTAICAPSWTDCLHSWNPSWEFTQSCRSHHNLYSYHVANFFTFNICHPNRITQVTSFGFCLGCRDPPCIEEILPWLHCNTLSPTENITSSQHQKEQAWASTCISTRTTNSNTLLIIPREFWIGLTRSGNNGSSVPQAITPGPGRLLTLLGAGWIFLMTSTVVNAEISDYLKIGGH